MLEVRPTGDRGRGVFAIAPIKRGQLLVKCEGWLAAGDQLEDHWFAMQVGPDSWLCTEGGGLDDCVNHSCEPNAGFTSGEPVLYALRDIAPGEEITWDYSTSIAETGWTLDCRCGTPSCRGIVRSWSELTPEERARLRPMAFTYLRESM
jgi:SET domain-containing protein